MATVKLTDNMLKNARPTVREVRHADGSTTEQPVHSILYDKDVTGLGLRVTAAGAKAFVFNYRFAGQERRYTIGPYGKDQWTLQAARKRAGELRKKIERGEDPLAEKTEARSAPTVKQLCDRFEEEHLAKKRAATQRDYSAIIKNDILPALSSKKVKDVTFSDCDGLHRKITKRGAVYRANRTIAVLSKMFSLAIKWGWRSELGGNPARGIERNEEQKRERFLTTTELERLTGALAKHDDQQAANIIRLLLLTGARSSEVQAARWEQFDLEAGTWTLPSHHTKEKKLRHLPLSAPARQLLADIHEAQKGKSEYVFPGRGEEGYRVEIKNAWKEICKAAKITNLRKHDLRHSFASFLVSGGHSLPMIGALLGHTQPQTTARYAHLALDPLREAAERVGAVVSGKPSGEVVPLRKV